MAEIEIQIEVEDISQALAEIARRLEDLTPAFRRIKGVMLDAAEENFAQQGRPRWVDLAPATKKQRAKQGSWPGSILQRTGGLAASIVGDSGRDYATVGTNKEYAAIHQFGGEIRQFAQARFVDFRIDRQGRSRFAKRRDANFSQAVTFQARTIPIPARPFLSFTEGDQEEMLACFAGFLSENL
ncbi:phage virion morphogenesis protein [Synechococcales cyanobacterium C]|uniref:Phage virion morphogenesis protein n=1 Tax=Petrachloros mirabilis ULC683 TaxID=2781853 RepID=A0A8K1ZWL0_9CYAN|nr:phage virion morphogenesis protein [Petrachloros mirabilis]NCJ05198.1 phage virion morphogenesis protein [Petrachloros mirabilis ULC683]